MVLAMVLRRRVLVLFQTYYEFSQGLASLTRRGMSPEEKLRFIESSFICR